MKNKVLWKIELKFDKICLIIIIAVRPWRSIWKTICEATPSKRSLAAAKSFLFLQDKMKEMANSKLRSTSFPRTISIWFVKANFLTSFPKADSSKSSFSERETRAMNLWSSPIHILLSKQKSKGWNYPAPNAFKSCLMSFSLSKISTRWEWGWPIPSSICCRYVW